MTDQQGSLEIAPTVRVLVLLRTEVGAALFQLEPHGGHRGAPRPAMRARAGALRAPNLPRTRQGALALQAPAPLRHRHLRRHGTTHGDRIRHDLARDKLTLFLARPRLEEGSPLPPHLAIQLSPPSLRDKYPVRLALPAGMRHALRIVFPCVLLWLPPHAPAGGLLPHRSNLFKSHWSNQWLTLLLQLSTGLRMMGMTRASPASCRASARVISMP